MTEVQTTDQAVNPAKGIPKEFSEAMETPAEREGKYLTFSLAEEGVKILLEIDSVLTGSDIAALKGVA